MTLRQCRICAKVCKNAPATREEEVMETFRKGIRDAAAELFGEARGGEGLNGSEGGREQRGKTPVGAKKFVCGRKLHFVRSEGTNACR
jgi:hypothetical protein